MKNNKFYIAIDIGGTYAKIANFNSLKNPVFRDKEIFELSHVFEDDFNRIKKIIDDFTKQKITAIGMGLPATLNDKKDTLISKEHIPEWLNINIKDKFSKEFKCKVYLENDAVTSALGEAVFGRSHPNNNFIFLIWGTGVGGAVVNIKPNLRVKILNHKQYLGEFERKCGGENLIKKYNKFPSKLIKNEWADILFDFKEEIINLSDRLSIKDIIIGGGIALKEKNRLRLLSGKLKKNNGINLQTTSRNLGDSNTFCLYGAAALIIQQYKNHAKKL